MEFLPTNLTKEELFELYKDAKLFLHNDVKLKRIILLSKHELFKEIVNKSQTKAKLNINCVQQAVVALYLRDKTLNVSRAHKTIIDSRITQDKFDAIEKIFSELKNVLNMLKEEEESLLSAKKARILLQTNVHFISMLETILYSLENNIETGKLKLWLQDFFDVDFPRITKSEKYDLCLYGDVNRHDCVKLRIDEAKKAFITFVGK